MTATTTTAESDAFLAAVKEQLSDLPEEERTDLLEDLAQRLSDITADRAEDGPSLTTLLGEPEQYAAELRAAADLPPRTAPVVIKESFTARLGRSGPVPAGQPAQGEALPTPQPVPSPAALPEGGTTPAPVDPTAPTAGPTVP